MYVKRLRLSQFRNYSELDIEPIEGVNILVGENAQGKSALVEAIYLLATSRSFRASNESEMVRHQPPEDRQPALVSAEIIRVKQNDVLIDVNVYESDKKNVRVNGVRKIRIVDMLGHLNVVLFSAVDLGIVSADPSIRRRYLNIELSQISPKYIIDSATYKKALEQRNRLLKELRERPHSDTGVLEAWDAQLVQFGAPVTEKRKFFIESLSPIANEIHGELTGGQESLEIRYQPSITDLGNGFHQDFETAIQKVRMEERRRGVTLIGPQRDDMQFLINGLDARSFASQGQQRTVVLSLKLAEFRLMEEYVGEPPVILLDDVFSDLDNYRRGQLISRVFGRGQTFITCTELHAFGDKTLENAAIYRIRSGAYTLESAAS